MLIDSHAHLTHPSLTEGVSDLLERAQRAGVEAIINICTHPDEVERGLALSQIFPWIYNAAATTPHDVEKEGELFFATMEQYARSGALIAVGETGLDYHYYADSREIQKEFLRRYLELAKATQLPVIIHCREAFHDLFTLIDTYYKGYPGVLHCFTGTPEEAQGVIERGWYLSLSGIVTFKKSTTLQEVAKTTPLSQLLIETDAPYLAPMPYRGKENEPAYLRATAEFVAPLRGISLQELAEATSRNAATLFNL